MTGGTKLLALAALAVLLSSLVLLAQPAAASPGWEKVLDRPTPSFGGVDFVSDSEGWMVAGGGLLHTTNGGATWTEAAQLTGADVGFADAQHGWLVGPSGAIYATADGGLTWNAQNSGTTIHLNVVHAVSPQEAWVLGEYQGYSDVIIFPEPAVLLHTTDGGVNWQSIALPPNAQFSEMAFAGSNGWLLGQACTPQPDTGYCSGGQTVDLLRTTDGGATWTLQQTDLPSIVHSLTFVDDMHGWLSASACALPDICIFGVYRTTDGGATWSLSELGNPAFVGPTAFRDAMTGWLIEQDCIIAFTCSIGLPATHVLRTDDGGATWTPVGSFDLPSRLQTASAMMLHDGVLYLTGYGVALRSADDGQTWSIMQHPAMTFDSNVVFVDRDTGYVISRGDLLRTGDAGRNWRSVGLIPDGAQSSLRFITANLGFTSSRSCIRNGDCTNTLWRTADGGPSWQPVLSVHDENAYFGDVRFVDDRRAYADLNSGVAVTSDGGLTWDLHPAPDGWTIPAIAVADAENLWAIFETTDYPNTYELRHSVDGGQTWQAALTLAGYAANLTFADATHGWYIDYVCTDDAGCIAKLQATRDGGATWHEQDPGARALNDVVFPDRLNGWANATGPSFGSGEALLHSADSGETWTAQLTGDFVVGQLEFVDVEHGWFALSPYRGKGTGGGPAQRTVLYHTTDAGGGPVGREPVLPNLGGGASGTSGLFAPLLLAAAAAVAFATAAALQRRLC
jgi:photosystem II stability/assembly factor-like uncharacterized protein